MNLSRRGFLGSLAAAGAASAFGAGTCYTLAGCKKGQVAVQLYSIHKYIPTVGLEKALAEVAKIGYKGVEFAGYYGKSAAELKKMLNDNGLVGCGTHVGRDAFSPANVKRTCEFNLGYGNTTIICTGGGNFPKKGENLDDFLKMLVDYYNTAAEKAAEWLGARLAGNAAKGGLSKFLPLIGAAVNGIASYATFSSAAAYFEGRLLKDAKSLPGA